ncbi:hypothetical protein [Sporosarcina sp. HYO08]|uniref:hypothetical protein n=1 Tax=Sporosarcina sp. HYO08 TaxID=1759557 RepID=UPI0007927726|nr:hypothetical protein [Sporosarcina sp. HYO08]KXH81839.1 hypothetical protein AU377_06125 [Sporosarcina sp. HYO08]
MIEKFEDAAIQHLERFKQEGGLSAAEQERVLVYMRENIDMMVDAPGMFGCYGYGLSNYTR